MTATFVEGGPPPTGAPHSLSALPPESPLPPWPQERHKALLLVAHADDETLFAGNLLLRYPDWEWKLYCMTGGRDEMLREAVRLYEQAGTKIDCEILGQPDTYHPRYRRLWLAELAKRPTDAYDIVFTHNVRGEYGHHHHVWCNLIAHLLYENVWDFFNPCWRVKQMAKTVTREIPWDERKRGIFNSAYGNVATGLYFNAPWLTDAQMSGKPEYHTQAVLGL